MDGFMDVMMTPFLGKALWLWLGFMTLVLVLLALDLGLLHRPDPATGLPHEIGVRESLGLSTGYVLVGLAFGFGVWHMLGPVAGINYLTGFAVEKTLALDNIFVISLIFTTLAVPRALQHRVLFWGILGVIVLRGVMIGFGAVVVEHFEWVLWLFGAFLILTGIKMLIMAAQPPADVANSPVLAFLRRHLRVTPSLHGQSFFVRQPDDQGRLRLWVTPLFVCLILVELADLVFAVDSIPAIFAITTDPYVVFTSNIFAILGLRALYFALAAMIHRFEYLKYALALILIFIGGKIFWAHFVAKPDPALSLAVTVLLLGGGIMVSWWRTRRAAVGQ